MDILRKFHPATVKPHSSQAHMNIVWERSKKLSYYLTRLKSHYVTFLTTIIWN